MRKFQFIFFGLTVVLFFGCSSKKVGLKENWVDERDIMALMSTPINEWMQNVGRPTLVEISGDTSIYYYNYRPTLYTAVVYTLGESEEAKPTLANSTEVWGSRKNLMQIKVVKSAVASAMVVAGPDKKVYIRDLNGDLVLDPKSGFTPDFSEEIKVRGNFDNFIKEYSRVNVKNQEVPAVPAAVAPVVPSDAHAAPATPAAPAAHPAPSDAHVAPATPTAPAAHPAPSDAPAVPAAPAAHPAPSDAHAVPAAPAAHPTPSATPAAPTAPAPAPPAPWQQSH
ncbi:MAG: hypothetical protein LBH25_06655 [Fibromonadaceae bacterium]|nr:hypothetical protein [Fibromonadaceae bacterium]